MIIKMRSGEATKIFLAGHRLLPLFICISVWSFSGFLHSEAQTLVPREVEALKQIGAKLGMRWNFNVDPCGQDPSWLDPKANKDSGANVTCTCTDVCHVTSILLKSLGLPGTLPSEFANLTSLAVLDLSRNYLNGSIPVEWASLPLTSLSLLGNRISGRIPDEFGKITTLVSVVLENNLIQGPIPESLGNLRNLGRLLLSANNITGPLPESLGNLKNLTDFRIDGNPISGKIPSFMGSWTKLQRFDMQGTSMEGPFPPIFSTLSSITELRVTDLKLMDGKFPPLQNMKNMERLVLRNLSISGPLPQFIGEMSNLKFIDLSYNNLTGPIPENYANLRGLNFMFLTNNNLTGSIPPWILTSGQTLDLSFNSFSDNSGLPSFCPQVTVNLFSSISTTESNSISTCYRRNFLCSEKAKNYNLFINCGGGAKQVGDDLYESDDISAPAASRFTFSASRKWAYSSTGSFIGNDTEKFVTTNVSVLKMPDPELYMTARLSPLSLKYYGLCLQNGPYTVSLHFAEIMFASDDTYSSLGRRYFDVSVQGNKVLRDFNIAEAAKGNGRNITRSFNATVDDHTLEIHFQWEGKGTNAIPRRGVYGPLISAISVTPNFDPEIDSEKSTLSSAAIVGIAVGAVFVAFTLIGLCLIWWFLRRKNAQNEELRKGLESSQTGYFTLKQIKSATKNFDPANKIGEGGFGPVYKGVLQDGSAIAVKQLSSKSRQGNREFINEIGMISAVQHPNLVKLLGCCIEGNQLLLVYEYMENNSLARALFGPEKDRISLDWQTRRKICLGIARGLAYLHEESGLRIVHRDIKATNVLLDKELNAKISDFGLARLSEEEETHISTRIAGTIGYMAPEYAMRGYLTDKADVYSFGVVMLEVVSGLSNTNYRPKEDFVYLLDWAYVLQEQGDLLELVDKNLGSNYSKEEALQMLNLVLVCTSPSPTLRPTMSAVVSMLDGKKPVKGPNVKAESTRSDDARFKAFEKLSEDSQSRSISMDGPWVDSSASLPSSQEHNVQTSRLLSDYSE